MKIEPVDSPIGRPTGTRKLRAAVTGRAVVGFQPCGGSQLCHKIPEPGGHGRTREDKTRLAIKCWRARKAGTRKDTPLRRFGTVRPRVQISGPRPMFRSLDPPHIGSDTAGNPICGVAPSVSR